MIRILWGACDDMCDSCLFTWCKFEVSLWKIALTQRSDVSTDSNNTCHSILIFSGQADRRLVFFVTGLWVGYSATERLSRFVDDPKTDSADKNICTLFCFPPKV